MAGRRSELRRRIDAEQARPGEMILSYRWKRALFATGLFVAVLLGIIMPFVRGS